MSTSRERVGTLATLQQAGLALWLVGVLVGAAVLVVLLLFAPPRDSWLLIIGIPMVAAILVRPIVALYLLPFVVAFGSLLNLSFHGLNTGLTDLLVATLAIAILWRLGQQHERMFSAQFAPSQLRTILAAQWQHNRVYVLMVGAVAAYLLVIVLSTAIAESKPLAIKEVIKWAEVLLVLLLSVPLIQYVRDVHRIVWAMIGAGLAQALMGYWQWVQVTGAHAASADSLRVFGTFGQPNPFVGYLNFGLLLALALVLFSSDMRERLVAGAAAALIFGAEILADSRGGELGLAVAVIVMLVVALHWERLAGLALMIGVPLAAIAWFAHIVPAHIRDGLLKQVTIGPVDNANFSVQERLAHWIAGLRMFRAHPILGVGAGNYAEAYPKYELPGWLESLSHAHNYYINAAAETGILGLLAIVALVAMSWFIGWRAVRVQGNRWKNQGLFVSRIGWALALGLLGAVVAQSVHNLTDDLFVHAMELQLALCLACILWLNSQRQVVE